MEHGGNSYYEIGLEMIDSGFEYFAGGALKKVNGADGDKESLYDLAEKAGYKVTFTQADAETVTPEDEKVVLIDEHLADSDAMDYDMDRAEGEWALKDYVAKGIEQLDNENGFFMMCKGGKIDWACHANDAGATVTDTLALADAVQVAMVFMAQGTPVGMMLNYKYVAAEIVHTVVGSFGLVTVAPLTAITSGLLLTRKKK